MPLDQHVKHRYGERQAGLEVLPALVHDLFAMADERQHREYRLDEYAILPLTPSTQFEVGGSALRGMEGSITQDNHPLLTLPNELLKGVIRHVSGGTVPHDHQAILVQDQTQFSTDTPAMIREAFAANLLGAATFLHGVDELDTIRVNDPRHGRGGQEDLRPGLMRPQEAKEPSALVEPWEQRPISARQPPIERPMSYAFERMQEPEGHDFTRPQGRMGMFGDTGEMVIHLTE
jgi:hypothetical protein